VSASSTLADPRRLAALERVKLLDTPPEEPFESLTRAARDALDVPVALLTLLDSDRQFFKSSAGALEPWRSQRESTLEFSLCQHAVVSGEPLVVEDAREHELVRENPAVRELNVVAYAGVPLVTREGHALGTLCAIDVEPHRWSDQDVTLLRDLARVAIEQIEARSSPEDGSDDDERFRRLFADAPVGMVFMAEDGTFTEVNAAFGELVGYAPDELVGRTFAYITHPEDAPVHEERARRLLAGEIRSYRIEERYVRKGGEPVWVDMTATAMERRDGRPRYTVGVVEGIAHRKREEERLRFLADHDALTGLYNRRRFIEELERELAATMRYGDAGAVLLIDLDGVKEVNDTLGHAEGDAFIAQVGGLLRRSVRATDTAARLGGDEFAVVLARCSQHEAGSLADGLARTIREEVRLGGPDADRTATTSIGVAAFSKQANLSAAELLDKADVAMYEAKRGGGGRSVLHGEEASSGRI